MEVVIPPRSLWNSITTSPSPASSRKTGFVVRGDVGAGSSARVVSSTAGAAFGFTDVLLPEGIAVTAETVKSFDMASLTADARLRRFGAWKPT
jgi:hypothetical protein